MKQLLFMIAATFLGTVGAFVVSPIWGVQVYYLFAVLRPQDMWQWSLPQNVGWSFYVAIATLLAAAAAKLGMAGVVDPTGFSRKARSAGFTAAHKSVLAFGAWVCLTYPTSVYPDVSLPWVIEYFKIFLMFAASTVLIREPKQVWSLFVIAAVALGYIGYEVNFKYLVNHHLGIYHSGYAGLDNNGAGLMLAMGIPLCYFAWEAIKSSWRWIFAFLVPVLLHAVLMTYSRGAMVALAAVVPLFIFRSVRRGQLTMAVVAMAFILPILAGREIRDEFFSVKKYDSDSSAQLRFKSWEAGWRIAKDYPIFGVGVRNSSKFTAWYGADMQGRVIHSQLIQIAADSGLVGLALYLFAIWKVWRALRRSMSFTKTAKDEEHRRMYYVAAGVEASLAMFFVGALFLSLEVFELPYLMLLLGSQLAVVLPIPAAALNPVPQTVWNRRQGAFATSPAVRTKLAVRR